MRDYLLGTWAEIPSPYVTHIMMTAGFDFSIIDLEHGVVDFETAQNMIFSAHSLQKNAYVRVPAIEESWTLRVLDMGCDGIIFPQVQSQDQIEKIINYSYFSPVGSRGFNPYITAGGYGRVASDFFKKENERIDVGIILEGKESFENIDKILKYKEIKIIYIGQYDLSLALGIPGQINHPKLLKIMDDAVVKINKSGKSAGCMVHTVDEAVSAINQGFKFIVYQVDTSLLHETIKSFIKGVKENESI